MYYIGIDGGKTYSRLICIDEDMKMIGRHIGNSSDLSKLPSEIVMENLSRLMTEFAKLTNTKASDCKGICIGSSGVHSKESGRIIEDMFHDMGFVCPVKAVSDLDIILATQTKGQAGIVVIASIESRAYAIDASGKSHCSGGWGYLIDSGGSAYSIGMQAVKYALMSYDGRLPHTTLEDRVREHFEINELSEVTKYIYSDKFSKSKIAELALVVKYASESGDSSAQLIEETAARELYLMARSLIVKCKLTMGQILLSGSVLLLNDTIRENFTNLVKKEFPEVSIERAKEKPEMGAIYLAMKEDADAVL